MDTRQTNIKKRVKYAVGLSFIVVAAMIVAFAVANVSAQVYPSGMVSYWKFDEGTGTIAYDAFNVNNGQLVNGPVWTTGKVGGALSFDGVDDHVRVNSRFSTEEDLSIGFWMNLDFYRDNPLSVMLRSSSWAYIGNFGFMFYMSTSWSGGDTEHLRVGFTYPPQVWDELGGPVIIPGTWNHVVLTYNATIKEIKFYVNGVLVNNKVIYPSRVEETVGKLVIGADYFGPAKEVYAPHGQAFPGKIDEVAIYNRALSAEEIRQHYQNGLQGLGYEILGYEIVVIPVLIDIKPGSFPNSINLKSKGNVPVAILSSPTFDATTVDRNTVVFAGASPLPIGKSPKDVNGDGLLDVVLHFKTQDLNLQLGDTEACLTGKTLSGQEFEGCDSVRIVK